MKRIFPFFLIILAISKIMVLPGCANIVPPQGGPRDSLPPVLVRSDPGDSSRNFKGKTITLTFDEFIDVQNAQTEMLISPTPKNFPTVDYRLNTVTVKLKDSLETNTTYSFNFGNSIKDINESNVKKNFTYIFSTGNYIDSLELTGKVVL
ncbi:MAG TPA: Ig-like domain-containing protein, partial [Chitinophagaceae bacterium]